jgi:hypothetical protein
VRPADYHRGAFDVAAQSAKEGEGPEHETEEEQGKQQAKANDLAKFIRAAREQFEQRFSITAEEELGALHQVVTQPEDKKGFP